MAAPSSKALLKKIMSKYKHKDVALKDVVAVTEIFPNLIPSQDTYNFNDGSCKDLLKLSGTIPVTYRGCVYNIPVELWLLDSHPAHPPLSFVRPTASMMIRPSCRVDSNGRVYLPYLSEWGAASDVLGLVQVMCAEFGEEPPVLSLGRGVTQSAAYRPSAVGPSAGSYPAVASPVSYPACQPSVASPTVTAVYMNQPPQLPPPRSASPQVAPADSMSLLSRSGTVTQEHLHASLVSAIVDQLRRREQEAQGRAQAELAALRRTQSELSSGRDRLGFLLNTLAHEMAQVDHWLEAVRAGGEVAHGRPAPGPAERRGDDGGEVDAGVRTPTPLHGQIVELHAQDGAIEDTAFQLGEAMRCNVVELDAFLKHVRLLARRQFLVRALMLKARRAAGLTEVC
uniref:LOW QUALITY PROTEIN: tumor susceptibility gene 101 protein-like n=1 Tax=Petromyzon marinus TaxID=7757 RepID=A0AAJ7XJZ7_PETMA|nr:LOW QUALITY PROTEIN: tumor susceptibility gene 101 protein-like [Petromyzon marinus]